MSEKNYDLANDLEQALAMSQSLDEYVRESQRPRSLLRGMK